MRNPIPTGKRSITPCCSKVGIKKGPWTPEEDEILANYVSKEGEGRWRTLPKRAGLARCGKSCRLRWMNYLRPSVKRGRIGPDEEDLILRLHRLLGNRWSLIAGRIPGRTDNEIKNFWNSHLSKKLISQGIDPRTHKPLDLTYNPSKSSELVIHDSRSKSNLSFNHNPNFTIPQETGVVTNRDTATLEGNESPKVISNQDQCQDDVQYVDKYCNETCQNFDGLMTGSNENDKQDYIRYYTEDMFSSFLDSLINEEVLVNQQLQPSNMSLPSYHPMASSSAHTFNNNGTMWEDGPIIYTSMATLENDQNSLKISL